jgi:dihydroorotate dehydrogenase
MRAGATLVAVGTESFRDPTAGTRIAAELDALLANSVI